MAHMPSTSGPVAFDLTRAIVSVRDYGAVGDGVTDDTAAIQAAIDAAAELGGNAHGVITYIPASATPYMFTNLKLPAYTVLQGSRIAQCQLKRIEGSTGNAITEKTLAEGNANGAISIWIRDLGILGNGTSGNGIDLGYNVADVNFETWASLENVLVQDFDSGIGIKIDANAISLKYIYALSNQDGVHATGGYSQFHTVYCEQNTRYQLRAAGTAHTFFGVHLEPGSSTDAALLIEGGAQSFYGVSIYSTVNRDYQIVIASGATKTQLHDVFITGGTVFTHGIYSVDYSNARTGTTAYIGHFEMGDSNVASWYVNADTGTTQKRSGDTTVEGPATLLKSVGTTFASLDSGTKANLRLKDNTALALGVGGGILFEGVYTAAGAIAAGAGIKLSKVNGTDGNYAFDLILGARQNSASIAESLRLTADGRVVSAGEVEIDGALNHDGTTVGLYGVTPTARQTVAALTDNSAGTANDTVQALTDPTNSPADADALRDDLVANLIPELRNNIADLTAKVNALRTALVNIGILNT